MGKLTDIYLMEDDSFTTKLSDVDPETGTIEWDVEYESIPQRVANELTRVAPLFKEAEEKTEDPEFTTLYNSFKYLRSKLSKYLKNQKVKEASMTGTGTSITPGVGAQYATPNAFLSPKDWKKKTKQMKYVENNEQS